MPIVPNCADCLPLSLPKTVVDYVTRQEVIDSTSSSNGVQVIYLEASKGKTIPVHLVTRNAGATANVLLIPLSGNPDLRRIFVGSASHPDFNWVASPANLRPGAFIEGRKFVIPNAGPLTVWVGSPTTSSRFALLYFEG